MKDKKKPRMIFSDIDGTFLTPESKVSPRTAKALHAVLGQGIPFALVSARMPEAIYPITDQLGVTIPIVSYSGAYVLTEDEQLLFSETMVPEPTHRLLDVLESEYADAVVNYYAGRHWYVRDRENERVQTEIRITSAQPIEGNFSERLEAGERPNKILLMAEPALCERAEKDLAARFPEFHVVRSAPFLLEIMDKSVSKATGIDVLLKHYGILREDALSFGDNYNDLEMLEATGTSVAMGNAPDGVKKAATCVTAPNTEDGIWKYLKDNHIIDA